MKQKFLVPALAISALTADAGASVGEGVVIDTSDAGKASQDIASTQLKHALPAMTATYMAGDDLFVLRLLKTQSGTLMAQHGSHASHGSHGSHRSHQSGR
ncbi:His-Xaa-Ser repeat protein HxsA2 [Ferrovibrio sp.]|uniref:His-Xaa-Ser repeat protein HxsA2 n=1 Tax=Ferrovibrio sp. TaxID=1917215 RepID=UPI002634B53C|nr:His-Xaa-Ser repeat protein HxsA2 [Ferrovibrio sp.]